MLRKTLLLSLTRQVLLFCVCGGMMCSCGSSNSSRLVVSEAQMSQKKQTEREREKKNNQQAKTKAELKNLPLSHKVLPLSSFSCFVSACPSSSNNQRPEPLCIPCQQVRVYCCTLYSLPVLFSPPSLPFFQSFCWPRQE